MKQSYALANKIAIANAENNGLNLLVSNFYAKYSRFTLKALSKSLFQEFLSDILKLEEIPHRSIDSIRIEIFPALRKMG